MEKERDSAVTDLRETRETVPASTAAAKSTDNKTQVLAQLKTRKLRNSVNYTERVICIGFLNFMTTYCTSILHFLQLQMTQKSKAVSTKMKKLVSHYEEYYPKITYVCETLLCELGWGIGRKG